MVWMFYFLAFFVGLDGIDHLDSKNPMVGVWIIGLAVAVAATTKAIDIAEDYMYDKGRAKVELAKAERQKAINEGKNLKLSYKMLGLPDPTKDDNEIQD